MASPTLMVMEIRFVKRSGDRHLLAVTRADGSTEQIELDTRSFLNHDLAHLAVEAELGLTEAFWGSVADGASLNGIGLNGPDIETAERLAGPLQTLLRAADDGDEIRAGRRAVAPAIVDDVAAERIAERCRRLVGQEGGRVSPGDGADLAAAAARWRRRSVRESRPVIPPGRRRYRRLARATERAS